MLAEWKTRLRKREFLSKWCLFREYQNLVFHDSWNSGDFSRPKTSIFLTLRTKYEIKWWCNVWETFLWYHRVEIRNIYLEKLRKNGPKFCPTMADSRIEGRRNHSVWERGLTNPNRYSLALVITKIIWQKNMWQHVDPKPLLFVVFVVFCGIHQTRSENEMIFYHAWELWRRNTFATS